MNRASRLVKEEILTNRIHKKAGPWVLAVSGGVDSMVLADILVKFKADQDFEDLDLVLAHFDHRLRPESSQEQAMVKDWAESKGLTYFLGSWNQPADKNIEAQARQARYRFLGQVCQAVGSRILLTAHHLNDQAETILIRLVRGSSIKGWQGIQTNYQRQLNLGDDTQRAVTIFRPLLGLTKSDILAYAQAHQVPYMEDASNYSDDYLRNRIRHHIVPALGQENPAFLNHLGDFVADYQRLYQAHYENFLKLEPKLLRPNQWLGWTLFLDQWRGLDSYNRQTYLRLFFEERLVNKLASYSQKNLDKLEALILSKDKPNASLDLGQSWQAVRAYDQLIIGLNPSVEVEDRSVLSFNQLNHWYQLSDSEIIGVFDQDRVTQEVAKGATLVYHLKSNQEEISQFKVRHRLPGDRLKLIGPDQAVFTKKLSRVFIDEKIASQDRDQAWLVTNQDNQVIWLIGILKAHHRLIVSEKEISHSILYQKH